MKINSRYIEEPLLQFGNGKNICPKFGIWEHNPYDIEKLSRPDKITVGIVGKSESIEIVTEWLESGTSFINPKESKKNAKPNLFPAFMGFNLSSGFRSKIVYDEDYLRKINNSDFDNVLKSNENFDRRIEEVVQLYLEEIKFLAKNKNPDIILCVLPEKLIDLIYSSKAVIPNENDDEIIEETEEQELTIEQEQNFRRLLKAKAMQYNVPIQIVRDRIAKPTSEMQDSASIAWNFYTALYYKASGIPWAMVKENTDIVCYAGISFYKSRNRETTQTSVAQIFDERGKGVILRGGEVEIKRYDRNPHLSEIQAYELMSKTLKEYKEAIKILPQRLVIHKSSNFNNEEIAGFEAAAQKYNISALDMITINERHSLKIYRRSKIFPPARGTMFSLSESDILLYTRGAVPFFETYPGKYIPSPLLIKICKADESPLTICKEILALSKMNWNNSQFDRKLPITLTCAKEVGTILKYLSEDDTMQLKYSFYM
jgi:hypothetical protein